MVAELFEGRNLGADRHVVPENFNFLFLALDGESARAGRLKSDEEHKIPRVG